MIAGYISHFAPREISNLLVGLIIFFSATQLGFHFWPNSTLVYGIRIDYLAPTLYFLDLFIVLYLALQGLTLKEVPSPAYSKAGEVRPYWNLIETRSDLFGILYPILLTNLLFSTNPLSTLSWSLHFLLYFTFVKSLFPPPRSDLVGHPTRSDLKVIIRFALSLALLFQTILAIGQLFLGHSLGGVLYYLGERTVSVGSPGIALATFMGSVVLRAYGTFGHPNVLAGYAVVTLLITIRLWRQRQSSVGLTLKDSSAISARKDPRRSDPMGIKTIWVTAVLASLLIFLTQSRSATLALFGLIIPFYLINKAKMRILYFVIILLTIYHLPSTIYPSRSDLSTSQRLDLQGLSLKVISQHPIFGTGTQASISAYPALPQPKPQGVGGLQPDHNSFTLFLSWFGLFGVLAILHIPISHVPSPCTSSALAREKCLQTLSSLGGLLPLLLLDHYFLTSPQGLFIFLLYLKVVHYSHVQNHRD